VPRVEIRGIEPLLVPKLEVGSIMIDHCVPRGVMHARLADPPPAGKYPRTEIPAARPWRARRVERTAFPLMAAVAGLVELPPHHHVHCLGGRRRAPISTVTSIVNHTEIGLI
jgi:hypothetical protein